MEQSLVKLFALRRNSSEEYACIISGFSRPPPLFISHSSALALLSSPYHVGHDFLSLGLRGHLVLWPSGSSTGGAEKEGERYRKGKRKTREAASEKETLSINHHRSKDNRKWQSPQSAKSSHCFLSLFGNCRKC